MIEIEVQNETHQTQERLKFVAVPRIGEGIRLREPDGFWTSYDVVDLWYQKAEFGDIWVPYMHVRVTPAAGDAGQIGAPMAPGNAFGGATPEIAHNDHAGAHQPIPLRPGSQHAAPAHGLAHGHGAMPSPLFGQQEQYPFTA